MNPFLKVLSQHSVLLQVLGIGFLFMLESICKLFKNLLLMLLELFMKWRWVLTLELYPCHCDCVDIRIWTTLQQLSYLKDSLVGLNSFLCKEFNLFLLLNPLSLLFLIVSVHHWIDRLEFENLFIFILREKPFL